MVKLLLSENYSLSSSTLSSKNNVQILKNVQKKQVFNEIIWLITTNIRIKSRSHRSDESRPEARHGYKYTKYKKCISAMMLMY